MTGIPTEEDLVSVKKVERECDAYFTKMVWDERRFDGPAHKAMILLRALRSAIKQWEFLECHVCSAKDKKIVATNRRHTRWADHE